MFMGYENKIIVDVCPKGTFKHPETGVCEHCMYECDDCESKFRCEDCRDIPNHTDVYLPCGPRCFSENIDNTDRQTYATTNDAGIYWDAAATIDSEKCKTCDWKCSHCDTAAKCTACHTGYVLRTIDANTAECISIEDCEDLVGEFANLTVDP